jgi:hypothetical protein
MPLRSPENQTDARVGIDGGSASSRRNDGKFQREIDVMSRTSTGLRPSGLNAWDQSGCANGTGSTSGMAREQSILKEVGNAARGSFRRNKSQIRAKSFDEIRRRSQSTRGCSFAYHRRPKDRSLNKELRHMDSFEKMLDKAYETKTAKELVNAPVEALAGVSKGDAEALQKSFGIKTIGDLAGNKYFNAAKQIADIANR